MQYALANPKKNKRGKAVVFWISAAAAILILGIFIYTSNNPQEKELAYINTSKDKLDTFENTKPQDIDSPLVSKETLPKKVKTELVVNLLENQVNLEEEITLDMEYEQDLIETITVEELQELINEYI